jgi:type I restriction enzyme, S subunit
MSEWRHQRLASLAEVRISNVDKKSNPGEKPILLCNYMDVYANDYIRLDLPFMEATASPAEIQRFKVSKWDVVITKDSETPDDIGIAAVVMDEVNDLVCGYHLALIKPDLNEVDPTFLAKQLSSKDMAAYFGRMAAGSTRYGLSTAAIRNAIVRLPPTKRQQEKIGQILQTIDLAIAKTEALIEKYQKVKAGLMQDLFTRGIGKDGKLRPPRSEAHDFYKQTPIGWLPKEWDAERLDRACDWFSGGTPNQAEAKRLGGAAKFRGFLRKI